MSREHNRDRDKHSKREGYSKREEYSKESEKRKDARNDDDSTDSESDYLDSIPYIDLAQLPEKIVVKAWREQRGICRITGIPMSGKSGLYSPVATLRVFTMQPRERNIIVVCRVIHEMREATTLPWRQFAQIVKIFGDQIGSGFQF